MQKETLGEKTLGTPKEETLGSVREETLEPVREETLGSVQSLTQARRILDEIAISGNWTARDYGEHSIVYHRIFDGIEEELTIVRKAERQWLVVKKRKGG